MPRDPETEALLRAFGDRVREVRSRTGMSQADVAYAAGLHPTYVSGIERGRRNVSLSILYALATALRVPANDLLP